MLGSKFAPLEIPSEAPNRTKYPENLPKEVNIMCEVLGHLDS